MRKTNICRGSSVRSLSLQHQYNLLGGMQLQAAKAVSFPVGFAFDVTIGGHHIRCHPSKRTRTTLLFIFYVARVASLAVYLPSSWPQQIESQISCLDNSSATTDIISNCTTMLRMYQENTAQAPFLSKRREVFEACCSRENSISIPT